MYPETSAGGFSRVDGVVAFYSRVQALLDERHGEPTRIVDLGAGRGRAQEDPVPYRRKLRNLRGNDRTVIGLDVDPAVMRNPLVDEGILIDPSGPLPVEDSSVHLVLSDFVFEHIDDPAQVASELARIVVPGGWVCARTPNRTGYIALGARLVPNRWHAHALRILQPHKPAEDTFPTRYRMNTRREIAELFDNDFKVLMYSWDSESSGYAGGSAIAARAFHVLRLLPPRFRSMWFIFMRRW